MTRRALIETLLALALAVVALPAGSASAQVDPAGVQAIDRVRESLRVSAPDLYARFFATPITSGKMPGHLGGAYQHYRGYDASSDGAIYWHPTTGANLLYGNILRYYRNNGFEQRLGYPAIAPRSGAGSWCSVNTILHQEFSYPYERVDGRPTPITRFTICAEPTRTYLHKL